MVASVVKSPTVIGVTLLCGWVLSERALWQLLKFSDFFFSLWLCYLVRPFLVFFSLFSFFPSEDVLVSLSVSPFFSRDFRCSVGVKILVFFVIFLAPCQIRKGRKGRKG